MRHTAELRRYFQETRDLETGLPKYEVVRTIYIEEENFDFLQAPEEDFDYENTYLEWKWVGYYADRARRWRYEDEGY